MQINLLSFIFKIIACVSVILKINHLTALIFLTASRVFAKCLILCMCYFYCSFYSYRD